MLVTRNFPPLLGGMERLNQHLLKELEQEHDVYLIGPRGSTEHVSRPELVRTCIPSPVYAFLSCAALKAAWLARRYRPSLIVAGSGVNALPAFIAAQLSGTPWLVYLHGLDLVVDNVAYQKIFLPIIRRANALLVNSQSTLQLALNAGLDTNRLNVLHPGVEIPNTLPTDEDVQVWREKHDLENRPILLSVGRLTRRKGLKEFILHALPKIMADYPDVLLVVIGEEPISALTSATVGLKGLRESAQQSGASESLRILGKVSDEELGLSYRAASLLVFPALRLPGDVEGFGMVAIEAAAHGLPTVAFAVGGVPDAIADGQSGWLITSGDYSKMAAKIIAYLNNPKTHAYHERACRLHAERFAWSNFGKRLIEIVHKIQDAT